MLSLREAARALHATKARSLADNPVPDLERYLIEDSDVRSNWGNYIGLVAESHHWSIPEVERELGRSTKGPPAKGGAPESPRGGRNLDG
jgi:hypothetical protein